MAGPTPMMRQYQQVKRAYPDTLVFFRLGDFYEMFFEDAVLASRELEITLTSRQRDPQGQPIPMCGVPYHALETYLGRLVRRGHRVAICEQVEDPGQVKGLVRREVTRVVTPGTVIEEPALEARENNFIAALASSGGALGAAFLDLSTGEFYLAEASGETAWETVATQVTHLAPREVLLSEEFRGTVLERLPALGEGAVLTVVPQGSFEADSCRRVLLEHFGVATLAGFGIAEESAALAPAGVLLCYVTENQKRRLGHVLALRSLSSATTLQLDEGTVRNLELVRTLEGQRRWTLLDTLDRTRTAMGARLLRSWMLRPSLDRVAIEERLDAVEELMESRLRLEALAKALGAIQDMERLLGRVTLESATPRDLVSLRHSLGQLPRLAGLLAECRSTLLQPSFDLLEDVEGRLAQAIQEEPPAQLGEGGIIREGYHPELDQLRQMASSGQSLIAAMESEERERTGIPSLKVKYNRVFGYFIEVTRTHLDSVPQDYIRKQTLVGSERFITPRLKEYEEKVLSAQERISALERDLFLELRRQVGGEARRIQETAAAVARLDVLLSLADVALRQHYVRPRLEDSTHLVIRGGRHPVVELQSSEPFVPNDLECNTTDRQLMILTGPNMGGKSTYLRQNALIVILAQMGSFVPADSARIGLVDRIYTRVGASDNLARGRSTFMVEMIETANILNTATPRSLILLDEVGRGTATFDGLSIAWAVAEYLVGEESRRARTLFATHYQELTQLEEHYPGVFNCRVSVSETGEGIVFFHKVRPGSARGSYGIEVARLAGVPRPVLERARTILARLERKELNPGGPSPKRLPLPDLQKTLF